MEKELLDVTECYGGNHKKQDIKTCGSTGYREREVGEEDENLKFFFSL